MFTILQNEKLKHKDVIFQCFNITIISSSNKYLLRICYVPGTILGTGGCSSKKTKWNPCPHGTYTYCSYTRMNGLMYSCHEIIYKVMNPPKILVGPQWVLKYPHTFYYANKEYSVWGPDGHYYHLPSTPWCSMTHSMASIWPKEDGTLSRCFRRWWRTWCSSE